MSLAKKESGVSWSQEDYCDNCNYQEALFAKIYEVKYISNFELLRESIKFTVWNV